MSSNNDGMNVEGGGHDATAMGGLGSPMDMVGGGGGGGAIVGLGGGGGANVGIGTTSNNNNTDEGSNSSGAAAIMSIPPPAYLSSLPIPTWRVKPQYAAWEIDHRRFEITKQLGKGSYGSVVEAIDHLTGRKVAIKKINQVFEVSNID